jgi:hypothetical protein
MEQLTTRAVNTGPAPFQIKGSVNIWCSLCWYYKCSYCIKFYSNYAIFWHLIQCCNDILGSMKCVVPQFLRQWDTWGTTYREMAERSNLWLQNTSEHWYMSHMVKVFCLSQEREYTGTEMSASYLSGLKTETTGPQVPIIFIIRCMYSCNHHYVYIDS